MLCWLPAGPGGCSVAGRDQTGTQTLFHLSFSPSLTHLVKRGESEEEEEKRKKIKKIAAAVKEAKDFADRPAVNEGGQHTPDWPHSIAAHVLRRTGRTLAVPAAALERSAVVRLYGSCRVTAAPSTRSRSTDTLQSRLTATFDRNLNRKLCFTSRKMFRSFVMVTFFSSVADISEKFAPLEMLSSIVFNEDHCNCCIGNRHHVSVPINA
ncbi:hypothetical protein OUZ56_022668 [Daphnia magna]|uniref:Uncharacterized protein n=1 Tax=Daphnia magna TaxID=35525 RepID=A0ABR0AX43_9CRUS|nr:hypothetical protein OUZ56_022668 [Daphnia magna]